MESKEGIRLRKRLDLRPIETRVQNRTSGEDEINKEEEPVSPTGRLFLEPSFNFHIIAIIGCKTKIDPAVVKANLPQTLLKHPRFSSSLVVDEENGREMKWVPTTVDLDKHILIPKVHGGDLMEYTSPDKYVEDYIFNLSKGSVDSSRPLWDFHILNVRTSEAEAVGVFRIHHSLGDGVSLMSLLLACTRQISVPEALPTVPTKKEKAYKKNSSSSNNTTITPNTGFTRKFSKVLFRLWWVLKLFWNTILDVLMFIATALFLVKDSKTPIKGPPGSENNPRRVVYKTFSLDDIKLVKNAMNMTVNDVALGITQAGLTKYLNRRYGLESKTRDEGWNEKKNYLPKKIRLRSLFFINIRPSAGIQALADMMEKNTKAKWGNSFGYILFPFNIGLRDDPLDYIREAKATIDRKRHSLETLFSFSFVGLVFKCFGVKSASGLFQRLFTSTTMGFSNVVGPVEEIGFYGHPLAFLAATTYGQANELMVHFQSYVNNMTIVLSVDETTIPDPHQLCDDIVDSLKIIKDAIIEKEFLK